MSGFLDSLHTNSYSISQPICIVLPKKINGYSKEIRGVLRCSSLGYVYGEQSKKVLWLKFLALSLFLPLNYCASKCDKIFHKAFNITIEDSVFHDEEHIKKLASIASQAVIGYNGISLYEYMEKFALAEIDYHNKDREAELIKKRSEIFKDKAYIAPCFHPLFALNQHVSKPNLQNLESSIRCEKYASKAIMQQQNYHRSHREHREGHL